MNRQSIEVNKNFIIKQLLVYGKSYYNFTINTVDFIPDEVIVKYIMYNNGNFSENQIYYIYSDLVNDILGPFVNNTTTDTIYDTDPEETGTVETTFSQVVIYPDAHFILRKPIRGQYTFRLIDSDNNEIAENNGYLCIALEFVKYKTEPVAKIY